MHNYNTIFETLEKKGIKVSDETKRKIVNRINSILSYEPRVAFLGKTGVGKSSLANALFGKELYKVDDIASCTRNIQEELLKLDAQKGIKLIDVPGIGESLDRDKEYAALYAELLPEVDVVLWLLKADDRAYSSDEYFYKNLIKPHMKEGKPFFIVLNQVDRIDPIREWNEKEKKPGPKQQQNIERRINYVSERFDLPYSKIIPVSATEGYGLTRLVEEIVFALPKEKKVTIVKDMNKEVITEKVEQEVEKGLLDIIDETLEEFVPGYKVVKEAVKVVVSVGKKIWEWLTS